MNDLSSEIRINMISMQCMPRYSRMVSMTDFRMINKKLLTEKDLDEKVFFDEEDEERKNQNRLNTNAVFFYYKELIQNPDQDTKFYMPLMNFFITICDINQSSSHLNHDILHSILIEGHSIKSKFLLKIRM